MTSDRADWSEPTLVQVDEDELTDVVPVTAPDAGPAVTAQPEPEVAAVADPEPVLADPPKFTSVPVSRAPVSRRPSVEYPAGESPTWSDKLVERVADVAVASMPIPLRVLDVGCGDGSLLCELILRVPYAELYVALDPRPGAVPADVRAREPRLSVVQGAAEALPLPDASFDLVVASLSLGLWLDPQGGAAELARVVSDHGRVIVVETKKPQSSGRHKVHSVKDITALLESSGLAVERVENVHRSPVGVSLAHAFIASP